MGSSLITAKTAATLIAPYVEKSWPNDRDSIYSILDLVQEAIWKSGLFEGSSKWAYVKVNKNGTIVTPHGYSILLGAKVGNSKYNIRDSYFMFHENGPLTEPGESNHFSKNIQFLGSYPTLINHIDDLKINKGDYKLGVVSPCLPPTGSPPVSIISANDANGKKIFTYRFREKEDPEIIDNEIINYTPDDIDYNNGIIEGVVYPVTNKLITYDNVRVSEVYNITKDPTLSPVDYYALFPYDGECDPSEGVLIASLDPFQTQSMYNVYKIVNNCINDGQAFCLFKRDRPEKLVNDSQLILTNSQTALISLAKGIQYKYFKDNIPVGDAFMSTGMRDISDEILASNPGAARTLQFKDDKLNASRRSFR